MTPTQRRRHAHRIAYLVIQQAMDGGVSAVEQGMQGASEADVLAVEKHLDKLAQYHFNLSQGPVK